MKNELYIPKLVDRHRRTSWFKKGAKDIIATAAEKVNEILENFNEYEISADKDAKLKSYMKKVDERTLEYYMKKEGISATSVTVVDGVEIKADGK